MTDLYTILKAHATTLGWKFSYGNAANKNLLASDRVDGEIYLLLDPITRVTAFSDNGGEGIKTFTGSFMLLVKSTIDNVYDNQKGQDATDGKYQKNIKPLLEVDIKLLEDLINCTDYQITNWSIVDVVNALDVNTDGIIVTYGISVL